VSEISYHLWIAPEGKLGDMLQSTIEDLAHRNGGPLFSPHITLLTYLEGPEVELVSRTEQVASTQTPFELSLEKAEVSDTFFQCIYLRVAESAPLLDFRRKVARTFQRPEKPYMPHLSLLYGDLAKEQRDEVASNLPSSLLLQISISSVQLIKATSLKPSDWSCVAQFPLGSGARPIPF
jgi:2'-5' RNA ligase